MTEVQNIDYILLDIMIIDQGLKGPGHNILSESNHWIVPRFPQGIRCNRPNSKGIKWMLSEKSNLAYSPTLELFF